MGIVKMASNLSRLFLRGGNILKNFTVTSGAQRTLSVSAIRSKEYELPDGLEHATGLEKYEYQKELEGKDDPIIVDAMDKFRLVGCVCEEHAAHIKWMWLIEGRPKRCGCGHWMKLVNHPAPDRYELPL